MDVLGYLKRRQSELERTSHPLVELESEVKYLYCFGLGVMALGNMKAITELQEYFETVLGRIALPLSEREQIIVDINNHFENKITECMQSLKSKEIQYCFIMDLYKLYQLSLWSEEYCRQVLDNYQQIFYFSKEERAFFKEFCESAEKKEVRRAENAYRKLQQNGYDIRYQTMTYFFPEFQLEEYYNDITVKAGETLIIDRPAVIEGNIYIERGGSLLVQGGFLRVSGHIMANGGRVQFFKARVLVGDCQRDYFMELNETAVVEIEDSYFDCALQCGLLKQNAGRLLMTSVEIHRTARSRAIQFSGQSAKLCYCLFSTAQSGALELLKSAKVIVQECRFIDTQAGYGGGISSESIANVTIEKCQFYHCKAKYLGAAIYFKYHKFGQVVSDCICQECSPVQDPIFHVYADDFALKIR